MNRSLQRKRMTPGISGTRDGTALLPALMLVLLLCLGLSGTLRAAPLTVAEIHSGSSSRLIPELRRMTRSEIRDITGRTVRFRGISLRPGESADKVLKELRKGGSRVDAVVAFGDLVARKALEAADGSAPPVIGLSYLPFVRDLGSANRIPISPERALVRENLAQLKSLSGADRAAVVAEADLLKAYPHLSRFMERAGRESGLELIMHGIGKRGTIRADPSSTPAAYILPLTQLEETAWRGLINGLSGSGVFTFSHVGHPEVRSGVLAGMSPELSRRLARRTALSLMRIFEGTPPQGPVRLERYPGALLLNARTAHKAGYSPDRETYLRAEILEPDKLEETRGERLDLAKAIRLARANAPRVRERRALAEASRSGAKAARSAMLPQVSGEVSHRRIDEDRARASLGLSPERETTAGVRVRQMIFDDPVITRYLAARQEARMQELRARAARRDACLEAGLSFVDYLRARENLRIRRENLELTRENLRLARIRKQTGISGPRDVYRLRMELADAEKAVLEARSRRDRALVALNRDMGLPQNREWKVVSIAAENNGRSCLAKRWRPLLASREPSEEARGRAVSQAIVESPEIEAAERAVEAAEIRLGRTRRKLFAIPSLGVEYAYDRVLDSHRTGPETDPGNPTAPILSGIEESASSADDTEWSVALKAEFPLFQGGGKVHEARRARSRLARLRAKRRMVAEAVEQRLRSSLEAMRSSYAGTDLSRESVKFAEKNLELVQDEYARGEVGVIELLDAQNRRAVLERKAAVAELDYVEDILRFKRALSDLDGEQYAGGKRKSEENVP